MKVQSLGSIIKQKLESDVSRKGVSPERGFKVIKVWSPDDQPLTTMRMED